MKILPAKIELAMAQSCLSTEGLAKSSGVSMDSLGKIRRGQQKPRPQTVGRLAKALNVPVEYLVEEVR